MTLSSTHELDIGGYKLSTTFQVGYGAWSLFGTPMIILASMGAMYSIEDHVRIYFYYLCVCLFIDVELLTSYVYAGKVCDAIIPMHVQRMGPAFVCSITE